MLKTARTALIALPVAALAAAPAAANVGDLTAAVNFDEVKTALYSVGAILIGVAIVLMAIRFVRKLVR